MSEQPTTFDEIEELETVVTDDAVDVSEENSQDETMSVADTLTYKIMEITDCTEDQAEMVTGLVHAMVGESIEVILNDQETLQSLFTSMLRVQVNSNVRLGNILAQLDQAEWIVVEDEQPGSDIRVHYKGNQPSEWVFEKRAAGGWEELVVDGQNRVNLEVLVGKFYDQRDRIGYIVDARSLKTDA